VNKIPTLTRHLLFAAVAALPCLAQGGWSLGFNLGGGPTSGGLKQISQDAGYSFGASFEAVKPVSRRGALVASIGYQWLPGDNRLLSYIPKSAAATGVNPTLYETRNRKVETGGFQLAVAYRSEFPMEGLFWQAGLRLGFNRTIEKDGGSQVITNGNAIPDMAVVTNANILAIRTIATDRQAKTVSIGPSLGAGYRFNDSQALTLGLSLVSAEGPSAGKKSGLVAELGFNLRF